MYNGKNKKIVTKLSHSKNYIYIYTVNKNLYT